MPVFYDARDPIDFKTISRPIYADTNVIAEFFYDNNSMFSTSGNTVRVDYSKYHAMLLSMKEQEAVLNLTAISLMELVNVFTTKDMKIYNKKTPDKKASNSKEFRKLPFAITDRASRYPLIFQQIRSFAVCHDCSISIDQLSSYVSSMSSQALDTNDFSIAEFVKSQNGILITHDGDYVGAGCDVISMNDTLLSGLISRGYIRAN